MTKPAAEARTARAPIRAESPEAKPMREPIRATERTRQGVNHARYHIAPEILARVGSYGWDLQWNVDSILGKPDPQGRTSMEAQGWASVTGDMWDGIFDGMFMPKGHQGEIIVDGLVLQARPLELSQQAKAEELAAARQARHAEERKMTSGMVDGVDPNFMNTNNPSAQKMTFLNKERIPSMPVSD